MTSQSKILGAGARMRMVAAQVDGIRAQARTGVEAAAAGLRG